MGTLQISLFFVLKKYFFVLGVVAIDYNLKITCNYTSNKRREEKWELLKDHCC